jgi:LPS sulfotransferase NodH
MTERDNVVIVRSDEWVDRYREEAQRTGPPT